jgi:Fe-S cluster assembly protein SufD
MGEVVSLGNLSEAVATTRLGDAAPWLGLLRERGRTDFIARGLPSRRVEAWKYSDLARALSETAPEADNIRPSPILPGAYVVAFENGALDEANSALRDSGAHSLREIMADPASPFAAEIGQVNPQKDHAILNLNAALMEDGFMLRVPRGKKLDAPLHMRFNWQGRAARAPEGRHIRVVIVLEDGAEATLLESHAGSPGFATIVTELRLGANARLNHLRLERLGSAARQSAITLGELGEAARYQGFYLSEGGYFARHEALLKLAGEGAEAVIDGAYLASDARHCDNTTVLAHAAPRTVSRQSFRGVLGGRAKGVYQGCVKVEPDAQGTDARQMSRALLLSRHAEIATKPELEIFADDVKCSHGATAGELDAAALFFLRARGIPETEARALLVEAFLGQALDAIGSEPMRDMAAAAVQDWLGMHAGEVAHVE